MTSKVITLAEKRNEILSIFDKTTDMHIQNGLHSEYCLIQKYWNRPIIDALVNHVHAPAGKMMVLGSFLGITETAMAGCFDEITGVDLENFYPASLLPNNVKFHKANLDSCSWELPNEFYDVVMMVEVLEHLMWSPISLLKWISKHCSIFAVTTPDDREWPVLDDLPYMRHTHFSTIPPAFEGASGNPEPMKHCKQYTQEEFIELLSFCGFKLLELKRVGEGGHQMLAICTPR